jgi:hypothetical protein
VEETAETEEPVEGTAEKQAEDQAEAGNPEEIS